MLPWKGIGIGCEYLVRLLSLLPVQWNTLEFEATPTSGFATEGCVITMEFPCDAHHHDTETVGDSAFREINTGFIFLLADTVRPIRLFTMLCRTALLPSLRSPGRFWRQSDVAGSHPCMYQKGTLEFLLLCWIVGICSDTKVWAGSQT